MTVTHAETWPHHFMDGTYTYEVEMACRKRHAGSTCTGKKPQLGIWYSWYSWLLRDTFSVAISGRYNGKPHMIPHQYSCNTILQRVTTGWLVISFLCSHGSRTVRKGKGTTDHPFPPWLRWGKTRGWDHHDLDHLWFASSAIMKQKLFILQLQYYHSYISCMRNCKIS